MTADYALWIIWAPFIAIAAWAAYLVIRALSAILVHVTPFIILLLAAGCFLLCYLGTVGSYPTRINDSLAPAIADAIDRAIDKAVP